MEIKVTAEAMRLLRQIRMRHGRDLIFHQSSGCFDGSVPMCFLKKDFAVGNSDLLVGMFDDTPFYMNTAQYELWRFSEITIDAVTGNGGMFSLDNGTGFRFLTRTQDTSSNKNTMNT